MDIDSRKNKCRSPLGDIAGILAEEEDGDIFELMNEMNNLINDESDDITIAMTSAGSSQTEVISEQVGDVSSDEEEMREESVGDGKELAKNEGNLNSQSSSSKSEAQDYQEPSTSRGKDKLTLLKPSFTRNIPGLKLNTTPVVLLTRLAPGVTSLKLSSTNEKVKTPDASLKHQDTSSSKKSIKKSVIKRSISTSSDGASPKCDVQASSSASDAKIEKTKSHKLSQLVTIMKPLSFKDVSTLEQGVPASTFRFELSLSPIGLADLASEPFRKFMNLATDCTTQFRKNQNQPLFGNVVLYFGDFTTLQSAMQRLCQLPAVAHHMRLNGTIRVYDFKKLKSAIEDQPGRKCLVARLMFQFCAQRKEKLCQLASIKDRKKESTKTRSALISKVPATVSKEMLLLLFPFSIDVKMPDDKQQRGLKGPVHITFESQEWLEAVLDCVREQAANMSDVSHDQIGTFRFCIRNYTPPKIPMGNSFDQHGRTDVPVSPYNEVKRGREHDRGRDDPGRGDMTAKKDRYGEMGRGSRVEQRQSDRGRKRSYGELSQNRSEPEKRGRFDDQRPQRTQLQTDSENRGPQINQPDAFESTDSIRQAAIAKGLDPNNPGVIKILEMSSHLQALQNVMSPASSQERQGPDQTVQKQEQQNYSISVRRESSSGSVASPRRHSHQRERVMDHPNREVRRSSSRSRLDHRGESGFHQRGSPAQGRERSKPFDSKSDSRGRDSRDLGHGARGSPRHLHREGRSTSKGGSFSPQQRAGNLHQRRPSTERHSKNWETNENSQVIDFLDPSTNDQPLDFQRPAPILSTEQAVQEDMARTMRTLKGGNQDYSPVPPPPYGRGPRQPATEEMVLPMQFGKNAVKKTPQAIMEEKRRKEWEESRGKEMENRRKKEEENQMREKERQRREMEHTRERDMHERQSGELIWQRQEREQGDRMRNSGPFFMQRERQEAALNNLPGGQHMAFKGQFKAGLLLARDDFQGEGSAFRSLENEGIEHKPPFLEGAGQKNVTNIWDEHDAVENRTAPTERGYSHNRGGFHRGALSFNKPQRAENKTAWGENGSQSRDVRTNIWDEHDQLDEAGSNRPENERMAPEGRGPVNKPPFGRGLGRNDHANSTDWEQTEIGAYTAPHNKGFRGRGASRDMRTNIWDVHDQLGEAGSNRPENKQMASEGRGPINKPPFGRGLGRNDYGNSTDWEQTEIGAYTAPHNKGFRGRGASRDMRTNIWDVHDQLGEAGSNRPENEGRGPVNKPPFGRGLGRNDHANSTDWEQTELGAYSAPPHTGFRGRGASRPMRAGRMGQASRGRGISQRGNNFHVEGHEMSKQWHGQNNYDDEIGSHSTNSYKRGHLERKSNFGDQFASNELNNEEWDKPYESLATQRGGLAKSRAHAQSYPWGTERGRQQHTAVVEDADHEWTDLYQEKAQFQQEDVDYGYDEGEEPAQPAENNWDLEARLPRGRATAVRRPGRILVGRGRARGRGMAEFDTGLRNEENIDRDGPRFEVRRRGGETHIGGERHVGWERENQRGRGLSHVRGAENYRGRGMPNVRGAETQKRGGGIVSGMAANRAGRGGFRGVANRGRGLLNHAPETFERGDARSTQVDQLGEPYQQAWGSAATAGGPGGSERGLGNGRARPGGRGNVGRGMLRGGGRGQTQFRGKFTLLPTPLMQ